MARSAGRISLCLALLLCPVLAWAGTCGLEAGTDSRDGKLIWKFINDNARGYEDRANKACSDCDGTLEWSKGRCLRDPAASGGVASSGNAGVDALAAVAAARAAGMPVDPNTEALAVGAGAFALGAELGAWAEQEAARGRAKRAAEQAQRAEAERQRREEAARQSEESWQRLNDSVVLEPDSQLALRVDGGGGDPGLKFGDDSPVAAGGGGSATPSGEAVMPTRRPASPQVKVRRYTPAEPPGKGTPTGGQSAGSACGSVGSARLVDGTVWFTFDAAQCPQRQHCWVHPAGEPRYEHDVEAAKKYEQAVGGLPPGVTIHDYEKVKRVAKGCKPA
jgi:hypothetical protein